MKEKRIVAMFITSAVTLVASLAITFGVFMTLADPVVATGVVRYDYAFNSQNSSLVTSNGKTLKLSEEIVFQPSSSIVWPTNVEATDDKTIYPVWVNDTDLNGADYKDEIMYQDESISTKLKIVPIRISNNFAVNIETKIELSYNTESMLGRYTEIRIYDYSEDAYIDFSESLIINLSANEYKDIAVIISANDSSNFDKETIDWGTHYEKINVLITNTTEL